MRLYHLATLVLIAFTTAYAVSQTFTVVQPRANKKGETKVVRPGEVVVNTAAANSKAAGSKTTAPKTTIKEETPAPSSVAGVSARAKAQERHAAKRPAVKIAKEVKAPAKSIAPAPEPEMAASSASPLAKATPPALEPVPTLSKLSSGELQQRIESALRQNTNVTARGITVHVTDTEIRLGGTVANGQEKLEAERLAQSFGGNRLFKDDVIIKQ